jgi:hypothetical protein
MGDSSSSIRQTHLPPSAPRSREMRYQNVYVWFIFVSALDIMLTWIVLFHGGREANLLANAVLHRFGLPGIVTFKFALVILIVVLCEIIGRRDHSAGRRLAKWALAISAVPVVLAFCQLLLRR